MCPREARAATALCVWRHADLRRDTPAGLTPPSCFWEAAGAGCQAGCACMQGWERCCEMQPERCVGGYGTWYEGTHSWVLCGGIGQGSMPCRCGTPRGASPATVLRHMLTCPALRLPHPRRSFSQCARQGAVFRVSRRSASINLNMCRHVHACRVMRPLSPRRSGSGIRRPEASPLLVMWRGPTPTASASAGHGHSARLVCERPPCSAPALHADGHCMACGVWRGPRITRQPGAAQAPAVRL